MNRPTATPRSTALPEVPDAPDLGDPRRPITIEFIASKAGNRSAATRAGNELKNYLESELNLSFVVNLVESDTDALKTICTGSADGSPTAAWVSPFTFIAAESQCGAIPALAITLGRAPRLEVGQTADIVARSNVTAVSQLAGRTFCRLDSQDFTSWIFPSLILESQGIDPVTDLGAIIDYPDNLSMLRAIYDEECVAAALALDKFDDVLSDLAAELDTDDQPVTRDDLAEMIQIISPAGDVLLPPNTANWTGYDTNVIPYEVLIFPANTIIPGAIRDSIATTMIDFFEERGTGTERLDNLLAAKGVVPVNSDSFTAFRAMLTGAKWDMTFVN